MISVTRFIARHRRFALGAVAAAGLLLALVSAGNSLEDFRRVGLATGFIALLLMILAVVSVGIVWTVILSWLSPGHVAKGRILRSFLLSWPARYVPGTIPYHAGRVLAAESAGSTRAAVAAAIGYEAILQVSAAALLGVVAVVAGIGVERSASSLYVVVLAPLIALPMLLQPAVLVPVANFLLRLLRRRELGPANVLTTLQTSQVLLGYAVVYCLNGVAFFLVLRAMAGPDPNIVLAVGAYSLGGAAGVLILFVPSGMGVREAVIVAVLSSTMPAETALIAAGIARAISVIGDLVPMFVVGSYEAAGRILLIAGRPQSSVTVDPS